MNTTGDTMFTIGDRPIGDAHPCFITFEAGATHDSLEYAKKLCLLAAQAGGDAVKFQIFDPDKLVADKKQLFSYEILIDRKTGATKTVSEPLYDIFCRRFLTRDEWFEVKKYCDDLGIAFFATACFKEDIDLLAELKCDSIKIASSDVNHLPLIRQAAETGMCLQLDTGNATIGEVEKAVDVAREAGNQNIIIHNCPSGYPARIESINLRMIPTMKRMFGLPIAFSDHTPGHDMDIAALALGANLLEKTITLDRMTPSVEHVFSLEPDEMKEFVSTIREMETALGSSRRIMSPEERERGKATRRSAFTTKSVRKGEVMDSSNMEYRRPGYGIPPDVLDPLDNVRFAADLPPGHMLALGDITHGGTP